MNDLICKAEMETQIRGQMYGDQGRMESGMNWESGMNIYTLLCIK